MHLCYNINVMEPLLPVARRVTIPETLEVQPDVTRSDTVIVVVELLPSVSPACQRKIVIRSGLAGKVMCPLKGCRAIFPRQSTSAAVSVLGLTENLDELLRYGHGADLDEADASTHALLPLPGGQLAVVRRDREREAAEHKASLETEGGADTVASAFLRAAHSSSVGAPTAEEPHVASQDIPPPASQEGPHWLQAPA